MDLAGLVKRFAVNRPLTESEIELRLLQKSRLDLSPHYQMSVIRMNSTYLETVDKWFLQKGMLTLISIFGLAVLVGGGLLMCVRWLLLGLATAKVTDSGDAQIAYANAIAMGLVLIPITLSIVWLLRRESFAYTHYPVRFNRRERIVYAFRPNGSILAVPWDDVFFTLASVDNTGTSWNIMCHVLDRDGETVLESFALSVSDTGSPEGLRILRSHWEFIRRYMEEGPAAVSEQIKFCLPIAKARESFLFGFHLMLAGNSSDKMPWPVLLTSMLFDVVISPFRFFAMQTSKIPNWPPAIETTCTIQNDDPFAIEGASDGRRVAVFPDAARSAGVQFVASPN